MSSRMKIHVSTIGREKSQILLIFGQLITYLYVYYICLEKSTLDNSVVHQPVTKKVRVSLIFGEIIVNLCYHLDNKDNEFF